MKLRSLILFLLGGVFCTSTVVNAQLVGDQIFLQGRWLEVGVAPNASWGNTMPVPATYHSHTGAFIGSYPDPLTGVAATGNGIDFSYDSGHDGWTAGSPATATNCCFYGPHFLPGTPFDGWSVQMNGIRSDAFYTSAGFALSGGSTLTGTNVGYQYTPGSNCGPFLESTSAGQWAGTFTAGGGTLSIRSQNRLDTNASWDKVTVTFKNTGATPITGLYYLVTGDPDNDQVTPAPLTGSFPTHNHISYQETVPPYRHEVNARPPAINQDAFSGLATKDCRAKAFIYQTWPPPLVPGNLLSLMYSETATGISGSYYAQGHTTFSQDIAFGLIFNLGNLAPGDSTRIAFAWIFKDTTTIDSAFRNPNCIVNCTTVNNIDTVNLCGLTSVPFNIANGEWGHTEWTWAPGTGLATTRGYANNINPSLLTGQVTYTITGTDTSSCHSWRFLITVESCFEAFSNSPDTSRICIDDTLRLFVNGDTTGATFSWRGPGVTGPIRGVFANVKVPHVTWADTGWYYVIKTTAGISDTERTHVMFKPKPLITATFNAPLCSGFTLQLYSNPDSVGETWEWKGPLGFYSTLSDPTRFPAPTTYSGIYTVIASFGGCVDSSTINVTIDSTPAQPTCFSNTPVCETDDTLRLFSSTVTPGVSYLWTGPSGFTSTLQNPIIPNVPLSALGTYTVTVRLGNCDSSNTTVVDVRPKPVAVAGSNSPVCSGNALNLTSTAPPGAPTFAWGGPSGFTAGVQNPTINPAYTGNSGTYSVVVTLNGCRDTAWHTAVVDSTPDMPLLTTNSPGPPGETICQGDTLMFTAFTASPGATYSWTGPNSFASTVQNPWIYTVTPAASGIYTVVVSIGACSVTAVISATVTPTPPITVSSNSPICSGAADTLFLHAVSNPGAVFTWSGPYTFISGAQDPFRTPALTEYSGEYIGSVLLDGCTNKASVWVVVNPTPPPPWVKWLTYCQYFDAPYLQAFGTNILWHSSSSSTTGTPVPPKPNTDVVGVSFYFVNQTMLGCESAIDSIKVTVNPKPTVTVSDDVVVCPRDSVTLTAVNTDFVAYYKWFPDMYLNDTTGPIVLSHPETNMEYSVVTTNMYGCTDTATVQVTVKANANFFLEDSVRLYPGESYQIEPTTNCTYFSWTPSGGLSGKYIANPVAAPEYSTKYVVTGITEWGCKTKDSININISTDAILSVPNAFTPGNGANSKFKVIRRGMATLRYFRVYDRWGVVVFETKNIDEGWDGTYKGIPQPVGVYVYDIGAATLNGTPFNKTGNVTLLR